MTISHAIFAAGCFWGVQGSFDAFPDIVSTTVGYTGGFTDNPTYETVCSDKTGHAEAVEITFDSDVISFEELLDIFFEIHDPTTKNRQGADFGSQYRSAVFYIDNYQKEQTLKKIDTLNKAKTLNSPIVTEVAKFTKFYPAEEYHQKYLEKKGQNYSCHSCSSPSKLLEKKLKEKLSPEQYEVLRNKATEKPFTGKFLYNKKEGTYICAVCGNPIFKSDHKFDSGSGWPSFDEVIYGHIKTITDYSHSMKRTEVICAKCGSHLGHVFDDGPTKTGKRFCINSLSMDFNENK